MSSADDVPYVADPRLGRALKKGDSFEIVVKRCALSSFASSRTKE